MNILVNIIRVMLIIWAIVASVSALLIWLEMSITHIEKEDNDE